MNPNSDFTIVINNLKAEIKPIHLSVKVEVERNGVMKTLTMTTHTNSKILSQEQNPIKNKNSIFVNIIHSLDALHMGMIIKDIKHSALPIHDAMLIPMEVSIYDTLTIIHSTFNIIHELNKTFKNIMLNITEQVGNPKVMEIINMIQPPILSKGVTKIWKME